MTKDEKFLDKCKYELLPWLQRMLDVERIHLSSMKKAMMNAEKFNKQWLSSIFGKVDTHYIQESINHSQVNVEAIENQMQDYYIFISKNDN